MAFLKWLTPTLLLVACSSTPTTNSIDDAISIKENGPDDKQVTIANINPRTYKVEHMNGGTEERVVRALVQSIRSIVREAESKYSTLAQTCIANGKPVTEAKPATKVKPDTKENKK